MEPRSSRQVHLALKLECVSVTGRGTKNGLACSGETSICGFSHSAQTNEHLRFDTLESWGLSDLVRI